VSWSGAAPGSRYRRPVRRAANVTGRVLITVGTLVLLFVAYQLWGTGIYEAREQSRLQGQLKQEIAQSKAARHEVSGTTTTTTPPPPPPEGDGLGLIHIPKIGLDRAIVQGVAVPDLRKGPGHYPDSPMPGQLGNAAIAGHRTTYGAPFNRIDELAPGDEITVTTVSGTFHYSVTGQLIVTPKQTEVLDPTPDATLTLTTCNPKFSARERLVVKAKLDVRSSPKPTKPAPVAVSKRTKIDDLSGKKESRLPVIWSGLLVLAVGGAWWWLWRKRSRWFVWVSGAIVFLGVYAVFCFYLERVLPPGY
jgi:sortase A